jgi:hypothetical protein
MKGIFTGIFFITILFCSLYTTAQIQSIKPSGPVICYQSFKTNADHIQPNKKFIASLNNSTGRTKASTFEVDYINFPADGKAKTAFQYAVDIWQSELKSSVKIRIRAEWATLGTGVLGQANWGAAYANFDGAQYANTFYPVALAEKIAGKELNASDDYDIVATFSSGTSWYFGTDGNTPTGKMDLVTIVLHEIAHGLGFTDTYSVSGTEGSVGLASGSTGVPFVYDLMIENGTGTNLFSGFASPSTAFKTQLTSNSIFYNTPLANAANGAARPKLYAPTTFSNGSSIAHLDEATFNTPGDANRLMTPQIDFAESIHDPGSILRGVFSDMGWVSTKINHTALKDTERKDGAPYIITATITSDNGYNANEVDLNYTTDGTNFTTVGMVPTGNVNEFQASIPGTTTDINYGYYISVRDIINRMYTIPGKIEEQNKQSKQDIIFFKIGTDTEAPEIIHTPIDYIFEDDTDINITAIVTDNLGVSDVVLEYQIKNNGIQTMSMDKSGDEYSATFSLPADLVIGDKITYRIIATDQASAQNQKTSPESDFYNVVVTGVMPTQNSYVNNFNAPSDDFIGNGLKIQTPSDFSNGAIHSSHPYENGSGLNNESNYISQLQIPIKIDAVNPFIQFDEIVLVEPGESGSVFGDDDFFDYVIVEGSTDLGTTWKPFKDGYDCRAQSVWLTRYNSSISNDNSDAFGEPSLFKQRTISMIENGNFKNSDEVLIRFRLFADELAHGWGWAIDNLSIQGPLTKVESTYESSFKLYPNPATDFITTELQLTTASSVQVEIVNVQGQVIYQTDSKEETLTYENKIDISSFKEGLYFIRATSNGKTVTRKWIKRVK